MLFAPRSSRRLPLPKETIVQINGDAIRIAVRETARARRYSLRLPTGGGDPVLTLPKNARLAEALDFVDRHRPWLADRLSRRPATVDFADGAVIPLRGVDVTVVHRPDLRGTTALEATAEPARIIVTGGAEHIRRRLTDFLRKEARKDLEQAVALHAARLGVTANAVRLKDTRSRWGSCTASGELSFSWRVIMAPPYVLDYLAAHEVAHLRELNHSHRFWRLVRETCPDMERGQSWLKREGSRLHAFGR